MIGSNNDFEETFVNHAYRTLRVARIVQPAALPVDGLSR